MANTRKNRVKLLDIAQASGVSLTAASLALSDKPGISQETRTRVLEMARSLGYRFKASSTNVTSRSIRTVGLLVKAAVGEEPQSNYFYSHVIAGVESACRQMGINLLFSNLPVDDNNLPLEIPSLVEKDDADALLLAGVMVEEKLCRALEARNCPVALIDSYSSQNSFNSILSDNVLGAYQATAFLLGQGHRQIGFVGAFEQAYPSFRDRRKGFSQAMQEHDNLPAFFADCSGARSAGPAALDLVRQNPHMTGLVCVNDDTAIHAMYALIEQGYRVPQDISIIGFDDIFLAGSVVPSLTTMRVNKQGMGQLALQMIINQAFQAESAGAVSSVFKPTLVERNSVMALSACDQAPYLMKKD